MKVVLFCGGLGMRIRDASIAVPKPLVTIGGRPIVEHVMRYYAHFGHREFILCLGYMGEAIVDYFRATMVPEWRITFVDSGPTTSIGERLARSRRHVEDDPIFLANYADGLTDLQLPELIGKLEASTKVAAFLSARPTLSYHFVRSAADGSIEAIQDAEQLDLRINGGYFVFRREIFDYLQQGEDLLGEPLRRLIRDGKLLGHRHDGFWRTMDTFKDKQALEELWLEGEAPWEVWRRA